MQLLRRAAHGFGGLLFLCLFAVFLIQIAARFGFNRPLPWTDEAGGDPVSVGHPLGLGRHGAASASRWCSTCSGTAWGRRGKQVMRGGGPSHDRRLGGLWALPATWDYVTLHAREGTPVLGLPFSGCSCPSCCCLAALVALRSGWAIWQALRGQGLEDQGLPGHEALHSGHPGRRAGRRHAAAHADRLFDADAAGISLPAGQGSGSGTRGRAGGQWPVQQLRAAGGAAVRVCRQHHERGDGQRTHL
jgi:hypothetical protein